MKKIKVILTTGCIALFSPLALGAAATNITTNTTIAGGDNTALNGAAFSANVTLTIPNNVNIGTTTANGIDSNVTGGGGKVTFVGTSTIHGNMGASNNLNTVTLQGGNVTLANNSYLTTSNLNLGTNTLTLSGTGPLTLESLGTLTSTITSTTAYGNVQNTSAFSTIPVDVTINLTVNGYLPSGTPLTLVNGQATGVLIAGGNTVTSNLPTLSFTATNNNGDLVVTAERAAVSTNPNSTQIVQALNALAASPNSDMSTVLTQIDNLGSANAADVAYQQLTPSPTNSLSQGSFALPQQSSTALLSHLNTPAMGINTGDSTPWMSSLIPEGTLWLKGFGNFGYQNTRGNIAGYRNKTFGTILGLDGLLQPSTRIGLALSHGTSKISILKNQGSSHINNYEATLYRHDDHNSFYINTAASAIINSYNTHRNIAFGSINRTAHSHYHGLQGALLADGGYTLPSYEGWHTTPNAGIRYDYLTIDPYTEYNAQDLNLRVLRQHYRSLSTNLGATFDHPTHQTHGTLTPEFRLNWIFNFIADKPSTNAGFIGGGGTFITQGVRPVRSEYQIGAGLHFTSHHHWTLNTDYDLQKRTGYWGSNIMVTCKMPL